MAYAEIYSASNDPVFQGRCQVAAWVAAGDIIEEPPATPKHRDRMDWASRVLQDKANITPRQLAMQVLRNTTISADPAASSDGDIQFQVNSILDALIKIG